MNMYLHKLSGGRNVLISGNNSPSSLTISVSLDVFFFSSLKLKRFLLHIVYHKNKLKQDLCVSDEDTLSSYMKNQNTRVKKCVPEG